MGPLRCEYSVIGNSVNLAARLMHSSAAGDISVDENVYRRSTEHFLFSSRFAVKVKGFAEVCLVKILKKNEYCS